MWGAVAVFPRVLALVYALGVATAAIRSPLIAAETTAVVTLGAYVVATAVAVLSRRTRAYSVARCVASVAGGAGSLATGIALHLHAVSTVEAYVVVPTLTGTVSAVAAMRRSLPRWFTLAVVGAALLMLGATWERRLQEARVAAGRLRPVVASLR